MKLFFIAACSLLILATPTQNATAQNNSLTSSIDKIINGMDKGRSAPGGAITITRDDTVIYNRAFGSADLEHNIDFTPETISESGSVAKQFTATAILLLINEGKLALDDDIRKYFPEMPDYGDVIKIRNLLTHTSGIKDWGVLFGLGGAPRGTRTYTMAHALAIIYKQKSLNFPAGIQYSYSNSNFILLGELVQRISKIPFTEFCRQRIFEPVGMTSTLWRDNFRAIVKNRAQAYSYNKTLKSYQLDMPFDNVYAAGALLTTTADLLKWNNYWAANKFGPALSELRNTHGTLKNNASIDYTLGAVFIKNTNGIKEISHGGLTSGYRTWLGCLPDQKISIAILCNGVESIPSQEIMDVLLAKGKAGNKKSRSKTTYALNEGQIKAFAGAYAALRGHHMIQIENKNDRLYFTTGAELLAISKDTFTTGSRKMVFNEDNNRFLSVIGNDTLTYVRVFKSELAANQLKVYEGAYYSEEVDGELFMEVRNGRLMAFRKPATRIPLTSAYIDAFYMGGNFIHFTFDTNNKINGFNISSSSGRADDVFFKKKN